MSHLMATLKVPNVTVKNVCLMVYKTSGNSSDQQPVDYWQWIPQLVKYFTSTVAVTFADKHFPSTVAYKLLRN